MALVLVLFLLAAFSLIGVLFNYVSVNIGFIGIIVFIAFLFVAYRQIYGLALMMFAIALSPEISMGGIPIRIEDLIIPVIFALWAFDSIRYQKPVKPTRMSVPVFFFLFMILAATINSFIVNPDMNQLMSTFHFLKHVEYVVIFFLVLNIVETRGDIRFLIYTALVAVFIVSAQAQPQFVAQAPTTGAEGEAVASAEQVQRIAGVETETANIFGGFLMFHFLIALVFFLEETRLPHRLFFLLVMLSVIQPLLFTRSRSTYVGLSVGLLLLTVIKRKPTMIVTLIVAPFIAISIFPDVVIERFYSIFIAISDASLTPSWQARLEAWQQFLPEAIRYPFLGRGLFFVPMGFIDNEYVLRAVQTGFIGLIAFLWVFFRLGRTSVDLYRNAEDPLDRQLGLGYLVALVGLSVHALAATSFTTIRTAEPLFFFSGLVVACFLIQHDIKPGHTKFEIHQRYERPVSSTRHSVP